MRLLTLGVRLAGADPHPHVHRDEAVVLREVFGVDVSGLDKGPRPVALADVEAGAAVESELAVRGVPDGGPGTIAVVVDARPGHDVGPYRGARLRRVEYEVQVGSGQLVLGSSARRGDIVIQGPVLP